MAKVEIRFLAQHPEAAFVPQLPGARGWAKLQSGRCCHGPGFTRSVSWEDGEDMVLVIVIEIRRLRF